MSLSGLAINQLSFIVLSTAWRSLLCCAFVGLYYDIVYINQGVLSYVFGKYLIHICYKSIQRVSHLKINDYAFNRTIIFTKGGFRYIILPHAN